MKDFGAEFNTLSYIINKSKKILLFAHSDPDGDTAGSVLALKEYLTSIGKTADIACLSPIPDFLETLTEQKFELPQNLDLTAYDTIIGCDSVERGFQTVLPLLPENTVTVILDHHPDITISADVVIIDSQRSSTCEIIYEYFASQDTRISKNMATYLMIGILSDTGNFQHSNTTSRIMEISSDLLKKGASVSKIIKASFANKKLATLKLWGRAFEKAKINPANGLITTMLTQQDMEQCNATTEDIGQVASILNTVPGTKFSLVLSERGNGIIKGSLRSEEYKGVDVSKIAHLFGGGGHKLASGFEIHGKIVETDDGWKII
jgi:bifunctional oligoribonuclease and PAP phosphatase NrnA